MIECEECEYRDFVKKTIQDCIDYEYSIQGRNTDDIVGLYASKKVECLKRLADKLGVDVE